MRQFDYSFSNAERPTLAEIGKWFRQKGLETVSLVAKPDTPDRANGASQRRLV